MEKVRMNHDQDLHSRLRFETIHAIPTNNLELGLVSSYRFHTHKYVQDQIYTLLIAYIRPSFLMRSSTSFIISGMELSLIPLSMPF
jgi:hypothetical protein